MGHGFLGVLADGLVELGVLVVLDLGGLLHPDGLGVVEELPVPCRLLHLLRLGLVVLLLLDLALLVLGGLLLLLLLLRLLLDGLLHRLRLAGPEVDGEADELGVALERGP